MSFCERIFFNTINLVTLKQIQIYKQISVACETILNIIWIYVVLRDVLCKTMK